MHVAANGREVFFNSRAFELTSNLAGRMHQNEDSSAIRIEEYRQLVTQSIVDGYSDHSLTADSPTLWTDFRSMVDSALESSIRDLSHFFPAWSLEVGNHILQVGPIKIYPLSIWLEQQQFAPTICESYFSNDFPMHTWKDRFHLYRSGNLPSRHEDLACTLAQAIGDATHVVGVTVSKCETTLSRQRARFLAQSALDVIALVLERHQYHRQFVLRDHPTAVDAHNAITAFASGLWPPTVSKNLHRSPFSAEENLKTLDKRKELVNASGCIIEAALQFHSPAPNSKLAHRWLTALLWAAEGAREASTTLGTAKFVVALDIMAKANKAYPIIEMIEKLLGIEPNALAIKANMVHPNGMTLKQAIEHIYGEGRSQILHGNIVNPMHRHDFESGVASQLARMCLRCAALAIPSSVDAEHEDFRKLKAK